MVKTSPFEFEKIINEKEHGQFTIKPKSSTLQAQNEKSCKITSSPKKKTNEHNKEGKKQKIKKNA